MGVGTAVLVLAAIWPLRRLHRRRLVLFGIYLGISLLWIVFWVGLRAGLGYWPGEGLCSYVFCEHIYDFFKNPVAAWSALFYAVAGLAIILAGGRRPLQLPHVKGEDLKREEEKKEKKTGLEEEWTASEVVLDGTMGEEKEKRRRAAVELSDL